MAIIQKTREAIDELQGLDFEAMPTKELKERRSKIRTCIEELTKEIRRAKKLKDSIRVINLKEARVEALALNEKMDARFIRRYEKANKIITIIGVLAFLVLIYLIATK